MATVELSCGDCQELIAEHVDDVLTAAERERVDGHLARCAACRTRVAELRAALASMGKSEPEPVPPATREALLELFRAWNAGRGGA
jgi:anti-sigma factor RsiW